MAVTFTINKDAGIVTLNYGNGHLLPINLLPSIGVDLMYAGDGQTIGAITDALNAGKEPDAYLAYELGRMFLLFHLLRYDMLQPKFGTVKVNYLSELRSRLAKEIKELGYSNIVLTEDFLCFRYTDKKFNNTQAIQIYVKEYGVEYGFGTCNNRDTILFGAHEKTNAKTSSTLRLHPNVGTPQRC